MNDSRRKKIDEALLRVVAAASIIDEVCADENEALENLPDRLRDSSQGESMQFSAQCLDEAVLHFDSLINYLEDAKIENWGG